MSEAAAAPGPGSAACPPPTRRTPWRRLNLLNPASPLTKGERHRQRPQQPTLLPQGVMGAPFTRPPSVLRQPPTGAACYTHGAGRLQVRRHDSDPRKCCFDAPLRSMVQLSGGDKTNCTVEKEGAHGEMHMHSRQRECSRALALLGEPPDTGVYCISHFSAP